MNAPNRSLCDSPPQAECQRESVLSEHINGFGYCAERLFSLENRISSIAVRLLGHVPQTVPSLSGGVNAKIPADVPLIDLLSDRRHTIESQIEKCFMELQRLETL